VTIKWIKEANYLFSFFKSTALRKRRAKSGAVISHFWDYSKSDPMAEWFGCVLARACVFASRVQSPAGIERTARWVKETN
jgi:hypothetical protein